MNSLHDTSYPAATTPNALIPMDSHPHGFAVHDTHGKADFYVDRTKVGWGLFVNRAVKAGEGLLTFSGQVISLAETLAMGHFSFYAVQIGPDRYVDVTGCGAFVNHACEPTCAIRGLVDLVALRDLAAGTEVTMDYSMSMLGDPEKMTCGCGSPKCRKVIASFDELPDELRRECLRQKVVSDFIVAHYVELAARAHDTSSSVKMWRPKCVRNGKQEARE